jgi:hypothetical protein
MSASTADVFERYAAAHPYGAGLSVSEVSRPPDVGDVASQLSTATATPDVFERYAIQHPYGKGLNLNPTSVASRPPDIQDTADLLNAQSSSIVSRPPDVQDTAEALQNSSSGGQSQGFDWNDWGIGIGSGLGLALLLGICFMIGRQHRHGGVQPA